MTRSTKPVNIIGGGFSGLIQAFYLVEAGYRVIVHEKEQSRLGGLLSSRQQGEFLVESAANAMIASREIETLAKKIQVPLLPILKRGRKRYIYRDGSLSRWPLSLSESWPVFKFLISTRLFKKKYLPQGGETLEQWARNHLGDAASQYMIEPAMQGVFAARADQLSAKAVWGSLWPPEPKGRLRGSVSPPGGMGQFIKGLESYLKAKGCEFKMNSEVSDPLALGPVILACGLSELKSLANRQKLPGLPESLSGVSLASLTSVTLTFKDPVSQPEGFGCLFPKSEGFYSLGVLFNHNIFANRSQRGHSETWILNDESRAFSEMSQGAIERYISSDRSRLFSGPKRVSPDSTYCHPWPEQIPIYNAKLLEFLEDLKSSPPPFLLMGNYLGQLGLGRLLKLAKNNVTYLQENDYG